MEAPVRDPEVSSPTDVAELHLLISEMGDELSSYRRREAIWLSIIVHVLGCLAIIFVPKWIPRSAVVIPLTPTNHNTTYLDLPKDQQQVKQRPDTDIVSDKNRVAQSPTPLPRKELLRKLLDARKPGRETPPQPPPGQQAMQEQPTPQTAQQQAPSQNPPPQPQQSAQLQTPPAGQNPFKTAAPGIQQAIQSMPGARGATRITFTAGHGGYADLRPNSTIHGDFEILSDTQGVDFSDYLQRLKYAIQSHWELLIPEGVRAKKGKLSIQFAILPNGKVSGLQIYQSSGDISLDRPAYGSITGSDPFDALPSNFKGPYLAIRASFYYNPDANDLQ